MSWRASLAALLAAGCASAPATKSPEFDERTLAVWEFVRAKYDADGDGVVTRSEYGRDDLAWFHLDADRDGRVTRADFAKSWDGVPRTADGTFVHGEGGPAVGDPAPEIALPDVDGRARTLAELRAERPVVLIFGSYT
jgi:hypothetical protein